MSDEDLERRIVSAIAGEIADGTGGPGHVAAARRAYRGLEALTADELELVHHLGRCASSFGRIARESGLHDSDLNEFASRIHDLQARVMAQAARRLYPENFR